SIMKKLMRFTSEAPKGEELNLSASNINTYLSCPLEFYLRYVEGFDPSDELHDYIDASTNGTIVHDTAEAFYNMLKGDAAEVEVTAEMLQHHIDHPETALEKIITRVINRNFLRMGDDCLNPLKGEALIAGKLVEELILTMLRKEKELTPFSFISAEEPFFARIDAGLPFTLRLKQRIDRIDRVGGRLRIVDYKTGGDSTTIDADLDRLFARGYCDVKAVRQLIIYCMVYAARHDQSEAIQPLIYKFRDMALSGIQPIKIKSDRYRLDDLTDYHQVIDGFRERLNVVLREIFDPSVPFAATDDEKSCSFCHFKAICGRNGKTD
ncbi:MAG: PD-(D/E)XK nuclease family protein, partial [Paramuribaculum sp.]|nr:PD-(D/E)XK nuclease family protein [Paramuribaculum sp.]